MLKNGREGKNVHRRGTAPNECLLYPWKAKYIIGFKARQKDSAFFFFF